MRKRSAFEKEGLLDLRRAANFLGIASVTLRTWTYGGKIGFIQLGRRKLFQPDELARFVRAHTVPARKDVQR